MSKSVLMGLHTLITKCKEDRFLYAALDPNVKRACEFFIQGILFSSLEYKNEKKDLRNL